MLARADSKPPADRWLAALYAFVFISGACGLMYEIVWIRALGRHFGTTAPAISTVLAAFMGGLALGNLWFGPVADRSRQPLFLYRSLELGIGLSALAVSLLMLRGEVILGTLARFIATSGAPHTVVRWVVFTLLLLIPTTLMGGTLPVLARTLVRRGVSGRVMGSLYALNTFGAVAGALVPDLWLVPRVGITATVLVAVAGNMVVALGAGRLLRRPDHEPLLPQPGPTAAYSSAAATDKSSTRTAWSLFTVSGFCAMGTQVLWSRLLEHWTHSLVTSFAILLAVFLLSVAIGSWLVRPLADRARNPLIWASLCLAGTGPAILLPLVFAPQWRAWQKAWLAVPSEIMRPGPSTLLADALTHAIYLELIACLLMGAAFPFLAAAAVRFGDAGSQSGRLYALNTLAGVGGSIFACFVLLPQSGLQRGFQILALLAAATGSAVLLSLGRSMVRTASTSAPTSAWRRPAASSVLALMTVLFIYLWQPKDHLLHTHFLGQGTLQEVREGPTTTAAVALHHLYGELDYMELRTPGVTMSDTSFGARRYMGMMGHLGAFLTPRPRRALLICYGVGNTAESLLAHPELEALDVVDISPEVLATSPAFSRTRDQDPLKDPRVEVRVDDGRHHLVTQTRSYDIITSEPPPPNNSGVVNLYSREYYRLARRRLTDAGVLTQWLPVAQLAASETRAIIAAFVAEFPHTALFYGYRLEWILVGSSQPLRIDLENWQARASLPSVAANLESIGVDGVGDLFAAFMQNDAGLRIASAGVTPVSDDFPSIQYPSQALGWAPDIPDGLFGQPQDITELSTLSEPGIRQLAARLQPALEAAHRLLPVLEHHSEVPAEWHELAFGTAVRHATWGHLSRNASLALVDLADEHVDLAARSVSEGRRDPRALLTLARHDFYLGRYADALLKLQSLDPALVGAAHHALLRGGCLRALGQVEAASSAFREAAEVTSADYFRAIALVLAQRAGDSFPAAAGPLFLEPSAKAK